MIVSKSQNNNISLGDLLLIPAIEQHFYIFSLLSNGIDEADAILEADSIKLTLVKVMIGGSQHSY